MPNHIADVPSPCVQVCRIDAGSGLCRGCLRSLDEITDWSRLSAVEKRAVLSRLPARRQQHALLS